MRRNALAPGFARDPATRSGIPRRTGRKIQWQNDANRCATRHAESSASRTACWVSGSVRTRAPHASNTALAMAAATGTLGGSPIPLERVSSSPRSFTSIARGASRNVAMG